MVDAIILMIVVGIVAMLVKNWMDQSHQPPAEWWTVKEKNKGHNLKVNVGVELPEDD